MKSSEFLNKAQRRIDGIASRDDPITTDPLRNEIALAQVYATLAVAQSIQEIKGGMKGIDKVEARADDISRHSAMLRINRRVDELYRQKDRILSILANDEAKSARSATPNLRQPKPWWRRLL